MTESAAGPWRSVVVDDEPLARHTLQLLLAREPDFVVVGECGHGAHAIEIIADRRPDVVFLDVRMPEVDGFAVLQRLLDLDLAALVVFVTAYERYALDAFEQRAFDYLLKPFSDERFAQVMRRVRERLHERSQAQMATRLRDLLAEAAVRPRRTLVVKDAGRTLVIPHEDIVWIEAEDYCARLHLRSESILVRESLRALGQQLSASGFVRVHRSAMANIDAIRSLEPVASGDQRVTLSSGTTLKVSRTHRAEVLEALAKRR
jgi:two-component system LytT family response regulator